MAQPPLNPSKVSDRDRQRWREGAIGSRVLAMLGLTDAHWVRVRHLWADRYRVNVHVGESAAFAHIAHSYFVAADDEGNILTADPVIRRLA